MDLSSIIALKATLALVAILCFREGCSQETEFKRVLGKVLGTIFLVIGVFAFTDVKAEEPAFRLCVHYTMTGETSCMRPTTESSCNATKMWFIKETSWHDKNQYCCIPVGNKVKCPNK